jgi:hypothetical protein
MKSAEWVIMKSMSEWPGWLIVVMFISQTCGLILSVVLLVVLGVRLFG